MAQQIHESLLSVAQAATLLGVHPNTIRSWTDAGRLTAYRINARGDRRFRRSDVARLLVGDGASANPQNSELAIFGRIAAGLAASPTTAAVARTVVEALRIEARVGRVAVYVADGDTLTLQAHAGFDAPPRPTRSDSDPMWPEAGETSYVLATRNTQVGLLVMDTDSAGTRAPAFVRSLVSTVATTLASARLLVRSE